MKKVIRCVAEILISILIIAALITGIDMCIEAIKPKPIELPTCINCECIEGFKFTLKGIQILDEWGYGIKCK